MSEAYVSDYLLRRCDIQDFTMVEIGHGAMPVAYQQPFLFEGKKAYIGVEAWLRDTGGRMQERVRQLHNGNGERNIFYLTQKLGGTAVVFEDTDNSRDYTGDYEPQTILPAAIADEVLVSNVFSDYHVGYSQDRTEKLLAECKRLLKPNGTVVLRHTIKPRVASYALTQKTLMVCGFDIANRVSADDSGWDKLEVCYDGEPMLVKLPSEPDSHYLFLQI